MDGEDDDGPTYWEVDSSTEEGELTGRVPIRSDIPGFLEVAPLDVGALDNEVLALVETTGGIQLYGTIDASGVTSEAVYVDGRVRDLESLMTSRDC